MDYARVINFSLPIFLSEFFLDLQLQIPSVDDGVAAPLPDSRISVRCFNESDDFTLWESEVVLNVANAKEPYLAGKRFNNFELSCLCVHNESICVGLGSYFLIMFVLSVSAATEYNKFILINCAK